MDDEIKKTEPADGSLLAADIDRLTIADVRDLYANGQLSTSDILDAIGFTRDRILVSGWGRADLPPPGTKYTICGITQEDEAAVEAIFQRLRESDRTTEGAERGAAPEE